ncbi:DUF2316 family protein [Glaciihabitans sp. UYNi722]|uniref:DUF2316 family protein n=1 Tax=Glaciihabitans sp. UYNi722 TaxID=3156344 RepID=UPI003396CF48
MLNTEEMNRTSEELTRNLSLSGLTATQAATDLGFSEPRLSSCLAVDGQADPVEVWQLRDYLDQAVRDAGSRPVLFTVLTEKSRNKARLWFRMRKTPRHTFPAS